MIQGYVLRQALWPLIASVGALGFLALLTQSVSTLDLIIDQRQSLFTYLQITLLAMPQLVALILPLALFVAVLYSINRMQNDSELVVCASAGMSKLTIASPLIKLSLAALIANLAINIWVQPASFREMRERLYEVRGDLAARLVRPGQFRSPTNDLTIYARDVERSGQLIDILIEDSSAPGKTITYMAKTGVFVEVRGEPTLVMHDGSIQSLEDNHSLSFLRFDSYQFQLDHVIEGRGDLFYKLSDRYLHELFFPAPNDFWAWRHRAEMQAEGHYRLSGPLYNIAFTLIALAAILGGEFSRTGYARRITSAAGVALFVRLLGFAVQSACADNAALNPLQYVVPIAALVYGARALFGATSKRRTPKGRTPRTKARSKPEAGRGAEPSIGPAPEPA